METKKIDRVPIFYCPICHEVMITGKAQDGTEYLECPRGCGEFWPTETRARWEQRRAMLRAARVAEEKQLDRRTRLYSPFFFFEHSPRPVLPAGPPAPGKGSRSGKRKKKKPLRALRKELWRI